MLKKSFALAGTTTLQTLYTVPEGAIASWVMLWVSNTSGSNATIDVTYYNAQTSTTFTFFDDYTVSSKSFFTVGGNYNEFVHMREGDYIKISSTQPCTFVASVLEYDNNVRNL